MEILFALGFVVVWVALQAWILPYFGVSTCLSGACRLNPAAQHRAVESPGVKPADGSASPAPVVVEPAKSGQ